ncbi:histone-lysine N-methyltransferase 2D-like, partial [Rhincodon typus]|uniref:histone-lysine N-methyltransferase 2D-like n=1 Tax=Rhincodon typus TaxID=259920 RepID=UPI00202EAFEA
MGRCRSFAHQPAGAACRLRQARRKRQEKQAEIDRSGLRGLIPGSGNGRLINPVVIDKQRLFPQDENLCRPPQPGSTPTGEVNASRQSGVGNPQGFHPRSLPAAQQQQWQQQLVQRLPGQTRFQQPEALHVSRPAMTMQMNNTTGLNPRISTQITFQNAQQQIVASPIPVSPQYIELRHNSQRLPIAAQLTQRPPQPRQRLPLPNQEISQFVHQMQGCKVLPRGPGTPLSQSPVGIALLPQQNISAQLSSSPHSAEVSNAHQHIQTKEPLESTAQVESQQTFQAPSSTSSSSSCCSDSLKDSSISFPLNSVPSMSSVVTEHAELDPRKIPCDDSVEKALDEELDSPKELDEEDDLANLSLDPDSKTDDELGNLDNLETNDPHLDDLLKCEEFDLLAYTDPELDTGDKKDIFTEQLRLVESANEKAEEGQDILSNQDAVNPAIKCTSDKVNKSLTMKKTAKGEGHEKALAKSDVIADTHNPIGSRQSESVNNVTSETNSSNQCSDPVNRAPSTDDSPKPALDLVLKVEENISQNSACQFVASTSNAQTVLIKSESQSKGNGERGAASMLLSIGTGLGVNASGAQSHSTECTTSGTQTTAQSSTVASSGHGTTRIPSNGHSNLDLESIPCTSSAQIVSKIPLAVQSRPTMDKLGLDEMCHHVPSMEPKRRSMDDLVKVESSLEASELPLLLHDLLEQEKIELQQQQLGGSQCVPPPQPQQHSTPKALQVLQQLEVSHQQSHPGLSQHLSTTQQSQHLEGPSQNLNLPQQHILGVIQHHHLGIPRSLPSSQQQQLTASQQRLGASPHVVMSQQQQQQHVATGQHPPQQLVASQQSQHMTSPQLLSTQQLAVSQLGIMQQTQQVVMQQQQQLANAFFPDTDLDKFAADDIMDPIAKAKMVALKGIKKVMAQGNITVAPGMNRQQVSLLAQRLAGAPGTNETQTKLTPGNSQEANSDQMQARPNPPTFVQGFINEAEHRQYEEWLLHTQQLLQMQLKFLEEQIGVHRKSRKALCAKQRTAKKAGREFPEADAEKLKRVTEQQSKIQKQLDQVRKQQKEHTNLMTEYRNKQQQKCSLSPSGLMPTTSSQNPRVMPKLSTPMLSAALAQQGGAIVGSQAIAQQPSTLIGHTGNMRVPQIGATVPLQQGPTFLTSAVTQQPEYPPASGTVSSAPSTSFFSGNSAAQTLTNESRLLQERQLQLQQRMQLIQQQGLVGPSQQQSIMGKLQQQGIIGQLQPTTQQSIVGNKPIQQGIMGQQQQAFIGQQQGIVVQSQHQPAQQQLPQQHNNMSQTQQQPATQHQQSLAPQQHLRLLSQQQGLLGHQQPHQQGLASHPKPSRTQQGSMAQQLTHQQALAVQQQVLTSQQQQQQQNLVLQQQASSAPLQQQGLIGHQQGVVSQNQQLATMPPLQQHHLQAVSGQLHPQSVIRPNNILRLSTPFQQQSTMGHQTRMQGIMRQQSQDVLGQHLATPGIMGQQTPLQVIRHQLPGIIGQAQQQQQPQGMIGQGIRQQHAPQVSVEQGQQSQPQGTMGQGQQHQPQSTIGQGQENQPHAIMGIGQQPQPSVQPQVTMGQGMEQQQQQPLQAQVRMGQQSQPLSQPQNMVDQGIGQHLTQSPMGQQPPQGPLGQGMPQQQSSQAAVGIGQQSPQSTVGLGHQQTQPQGPGGMGKQQPHHQAILVMGQQQAQHQGAIGLGQQQAQPQGPTGV